MASRVLSFPPQPGEPKAGEPSAQPERSPERSPEVERPCSAIGPYRGLHLVRALHGCAESYVHTGNPLDIATQLCAVAVHWDWSLAQQMTLEGLRRLARIPASRVAAQPLLLQRASGLLPGSSSSSAGPSAS